jgi:hypothetical protein
MPGSAADSAIGRGVPRDPVAVPAFAERFADDSTESSRALRRATPGVGVRTPGTPPGRRAT